MPKGLKKYYFKYTNIDLSFNVLVSFVTAKLIRYFHLTDGEKRSHPFALSVDCSRLSVTV